MPELTSLDLAKKTIHLLIQPQLTRLDLERGCELAARVQCHAVMVQPHYVETAKRLLKESRVKIIALVGSTNGGTSTATKMYETQDVIQRGADEVALVINFGALRDQEDLIVRNDITSAVQTARGRPVTLVLENFLSVEEKTRACKIAERTRVAFVQTSLGETDDAMTLANVKILSVAANVPILGAGRIGSPTHAQALFEAGAARIATRETEKLLSGGGREQGN
jgi:deoxyribose-phosphate aldolase